MLGFYFGIWAYRGFPIMYWMTGQRIMYISDIAAFQLQPIFIACASTQGILFVLSLAIELRLKYKGRLRQGTYMLKWIRICSYISLAAAVCGQFCVLLVSIYNTVTYAYFHIVMLVMFVVFLGISSFFCSVGLFLLTLDYPRKTRILASLIVRILWFFTEISLAIAFGATAIPHKDASAVCEWVLAVLYPVYQLTIAWDLYPANDKPVGHYFRSDIYPEYIDDSARYTDTIDLDATTEYDIDSEDEPNEVDTILDYPSNQDTNNLSVDDTEASERQNLLEFAHE